MRGRQDYSKTSDLIAAENKLTEVKGIVIVGFCSAGIKCNAGN